MKQATETKRTTTKNRAIQRESAQRNAWLFWAAACLVVAAAIRLVLLTQKVLHHDEGVNGLFITGLFRTGNYEYNPTNYHGPSLYYFALVTAKLNSLLYGKAGLSTFAIRLVPAIFGIGIVGLALLLRRWIGSFGAIATALLLAVSPGMVFFSRYFIHEIPFMFFTFGLVLAVAEYDRTGRPLYLILAAASAAFLFATKETCIITFAVLALSDLCTRVYLVLRKNLGARLNTSSIDKRGNARRKSRRSGHIPRHAKKEQADAVPPESEAIHTAPWRNVPLFFAAAAVFIVISVLLFSSFFTNFPKGVYDSVRTFATWTKTGTTQYLSGPFTYVKWLGNEELAILTLGITGVITALWQASSRFAIFSAFWSLGITAAYSLVPYKTPWLTLNLILPLAIMSGYALARCFEFGKSKSAFQAIAVLFLVGAIALGIYQAIDVSFYRYDDDTVAYSYAHTKRDFLNLVNEIESIAADNHLGTDMGITVVSPEHWPMYWYLRDYPKAGYWGQIVDTHEAVIIALEPQASEIERRFGASYRRISAHDLRPGNKLVLFLRRDLNP
ncbi:MAG TPA: flippase activity-associated protein Agl23 [Candidatus Angelobacter sp.]|nr:flippase activity-associated protein Agl23 [Candidatus Angelobacter sp.]